MKYSEKKFYSIDCQGCIGVRTNDGPFLQYLTLWDEDGNLLATNVVASNPDTGALSIQECVETIFGPEGPYAFISSRPVQYMSFPVMHGIPLRQLTDKGMARIVGETDADDVEGDDVATNGPYTAQDVVDAAIAMGINPVAMISMSAKHLDS